MKGSPVSLPITAPTAIPLRSGHYGSPLAQNMVYGDCLQEALFIPQLEGMAFVGRFPRRLRQLDSRFVPVLSDAEHVCVEVAHFKCSTSRAFVPPCGVTKEIRKRNGTT
jgi:hypothetical protein